MSRTQLLYVLIKRAQDHSWEVEGPPAWVLQSANDFTNRRLQAVLDTEESMRKSELADRERYARSQGRDFDPDGPPLDFPFDTFSHRKSDKPEDLPLIGLSPRDLYLARKGHQFIGGSDFRGPPMTDDDINAVRKILPPISSFINPKSAWDYTSNVTRRNAIKTKLENLAYEKLAQWPRGTMDELSALFPGGASEVFALYERHGYQPDQIRYLAGKPPEVRAAIQGPDDNLNRARARGLGADVTETMEELERIAQSRIPDLPPSDEDIAAGGGQLNRDVRATPPEDAVTSPDNNADSDMAQSDAMASLDPTPAAPNVGFVPGNRSRPRPDQDGVQGVTPAPEPAQASAATDPGAPKSMMAGIPSAALWAAGGVGAAGLLGYLLSRNRRRNRDADAA